MTRRHASLGARFAGALLVAATIARAEIPTRNLTVLAHRDDYAVPGGIGYSSGWSYVHGDGREYAALGTLTGTAIYRLSDPANPVLVGFVPGPYSYVREMKSYREWLYISADATGAGQGIQVVRMSDPDSPLLVATYASDFVRTHTLSVDTTRALLYCNGTRSSGGGEIGMRILSLANPEAPVQVGRWPAAPFPPHEQYVHDGAVAGTRYYASSLYGGQRALDLSNPAAPAQLSNWLYPGVFAHSAWPDTSGRWLYVCDEMSAERLKVFDVQNVAQPVLAYALTPNPSAIVHNPRVSGAELWVSSYSEGVRVYDLSHPQRPAEFAFADTYVDPAFGYNGCWEVCPYFPSGIAIATDRQSGLWVLQAQHDYGIVSVEVRDADADTALAGAEVFMDAPAESLATLADGIVRFAADPGSVTLHAAKFGWAEASAAVSVTQGGLVNVTLELQPLPLGSFSGELRDALTDALLEDSEVVLEWTPAHAHADSLGAFAIEGIPAGDYAVIAHAAGHAPLRFTRHLDASANVQTLRLRPAAAFDPLEAPGDWTVGAAGDDATHGYWVRVEPFGTGEPEPGGVALASEGRVALRASAGPAPALHHEELGAAYPGEANPEFDHTPDGDTCWASGQGDNALAVRQVDVDGGRTSLVSPAFDLTGMSEPTLGWWQWFYTDVSDGDWLAVLISNDDGASWAPVDTTRDLGENHWHERSVRVADYVTPSAQVRLRFVAADLGDDSVVEAAVDDVIAYDAALPSVGIDAGERALDGAPRIRAWPNPARGAVSFALTLPSAARVRVEIADVAGRMVRRLFSGELAAGETRLQWDGRDAAGRATPPGLYFARTVSERREVEARFVRLR